MATLNITITAGLSDFNLFADELGYNDNITTIVSNLPVISPNPQSRQQFLQEQFKKVTTDWLTSKKIIAIDNQIRDQRIAEKDALKTAINNAVSVNFV